MNILLADPDRDFLESYRRVLELAGHTVSTAFDGTMVSQLLAEGHFDMAILDEQLPRVPHDRLVGWLKSERVPVIALCDSRVTCATLMRAPLCAAYLSFPFLPEELLALIDNVDSKAHSTETLPFARFDIDIARFSLGGGRIALTAAEIDLVAALEGRGDMPRRRLPALVDALNRKLAALGSAALVKYELEKGYRLVNEA